MSRLALGLLLGLCATPVAMFLAIYSSGAGHGDYVLARILYPIPMLTTVLTDRTITPFAIVLALIQFPAYGAFIGRSGSGFASSLALGAFHGLAALAAFSGVLSAFSG